MRRTEPGADPSHVIVLASTGAPIRSRLRGRRAVPIDPLPQPEPVPLSRVTVISTARFEQETEARQWLDALDLDDACADALAIVNEMMQAHRVATANPHVHELARADAVAVRAGYGDGEHVADGRWSAARQAPPPRPARQPRHAALQPTERLAALLGARDVALACEELALRTRLDVDAGRPVHAALGLRGALAVAVRELDGDTLGERVDELRELQAGVDAAAEAAGVGELSTEQSELVEHALRRLEAALRARTVLSLRA